MDELKKLIDSIIDEAVSINLKITYLNNNLFLEDSELKLKVFQDEYIVSFDGSKIFAPDFIPYGLKLVSNVNGTFIEFSVDNFYKDGIKGYNKILNEIKNRIRDNKDIEDLKKFKILVEDINKEIVIFQTLRRINNSLLIYTQFSKQFGSDL